MRLTQPTLAVLLSTCAALLPITGAADDWPQWRGPDRTGKSRESAWLHEWPADGPKTAWKASVGLGFSSVVVANGRALTLGYANEQDTVHCLDADSGKVLWTHSYPSQLGDKYFEGGTTGTPTVAGNRVFVLSRWGDAMALDAATGKVLWSKNIGPESGARQPDWGFTGAPLVIGDRVYLNAGEAGLALRASDGTVVWTSAKKEAGYSTPLPFTDGADQLAVFSSGDAYTAVRLSDGQKAWSVRWLTQYGVNAADPILHDGHLFVSSGYGKGSGFFKLAKPEPESIWKNKTLSTQMNSAVLHEGHLYGTAGDTTTKAALKCVEWSTGQEKWAFPNFGSGGVILAGNRLIAISGTGELMTAPASPEAFKPTARAQVVGGKTWTAPVLANGRVYCRNSTGHLVCIDLRQP
jgi:outer membrane protein assembly factor BamB